MTEPDFTYTDEECTPQHGDSRADVHRKVYNAQIREAIEAGTMEPTYVGITDFLATYEFDDARLVRAWDEFCPCTMDESCACGNAPCLGPAPWVEEVRKSMVPTLTVVK